MTTIKIIIIMVWCCAIRYVNHVFNNVMLYVQEHKVLYIFWFYSVEQRFEKNEQDFLGIR